MSASLRADATNLKAFLFTFLLLGVVPASAQEAPPVAAEDTAANPLATLNEQVKDVLAKAAVPFSQDQERAIALMMEERRRASEELFGDLMDFRSGPTQGQEADRLRSAIEWMRTEFLRHLTDYLTEAQNLAWTSHQAAAAATTTEKPASQASQTQYVRINNNSFTSENNGFGSGGDSTEVIPRGGTGAWHGNSQFLLKDDALNARNAFAGNKPPYQERRLSMDVSGPSIPGRLSSSLAFYQTESKNVGTIHATLPDGIFALGITRPYVYREVEGRSTYQVADAHSVRFMVRRGAETSRDQGIGGFALPERRYDAFYRQWNAGVYPFSMLSDRSIHEARFQINSSSGENVPFSDAVRINVLDAFNGGGAQNKAEDVNRSYEFGNLYTRLGEVFTLKTGIEGIYRIEQSTSINNFGGTFTFSSLETYRAGTPTTFRVNRGNPSLDVRQLEAAGFVQTDAKVNSRLTLMFGVRYEAQHNLADYNNIDPRFGFAYSPGRALVIRGGGGIFHTRLQTNHVKNQRRFDGTRQFEIVIDHPSYPDAFAAGTIRQTFPSVRVTDPDLQAPYFGVGMVSLERTFLSNLLVTATYDVQREYHKLRTRNINAPYDARFEARQACSVDTPEDLCVKPDPTRGNLINLESTGNDTKQTLRFSVRKRFSIFNGSANYQLQRVRGDVQGGAGTLATDAYNLAADYGRSPNPTHDVSASLNASLPLGIFISGQMAYNSGRFYTITTGTDDNRDSNVNDRPAGRLSNTEHGPKYLNFDFNISKAFFLRRAAGSATSGMNINVFANMTNAFNHVHYGTPSGVLSSPNFGKITSASDPREIEAGVRFQF
jgi:hypothetical protein